MPYYIPYMCKGAHHSERVDVLQDRSFKECLITHITSKRALTTMQAFVLPDRSYERMPYYIPYKYKGAHHYVCVGVSSNYQYP